MYKRQGEKNTGQTDECANTATPATEATTGTFGKTPTGGGKDTRPSDGPKPSITVRSSWGSNPGKVRKRKRKGTKRNRSSALTRENPPKTPVGSCTLKRIK